ncbi:MAG: hypothetical protein FJW14_06910 [Acidimicrobiia bacterium]|nr:hypothetical protein [Acidimicrobiia bacterium]
MPNTGEAILRTFLEDSSRRPADTLKYHELQGFLFAVHGFDCCIVGCLGAAIRKLEIEFNAQCLAFEIQSSTRTNKRPEQLSPVFNGHGPFDVESPNAPGRLARLWGRDVWPFAYMS